MGLGCGEQVQVEHHEENKCLKPADLCGDNGLVKMCGRVDHRELPSVAKMCARHI